MIPMSLLSISHSKGGDEEFMRKRNGMAEELPLYLNKVYNIPIGIVVVEETGKAVKIQLKLFRN